jgi:hypothetical protein
MASSLHHDAEAAMLLLQAVGAAGSIAARAQTISPAEVRALLTLSTATADTTRRPGRSGPAESRTMGHRPPQRPRSGRHPERAAWSRLITGTETTSRRASGSQECVQ